MLRTKWKQDGQSDCIIRPSMDNQTASFFQVSSPDCDRSWNENWNGVREESLRGFSIISLLFHDFRNDNTKRNSCFSIFFQRKYHRISIYLSIPLPNFYVGSSSQILRRCLFPWHQELFEDTNYASLHTTSIALVSGSGFAHYLRTLLVMEEADKWKRDVQKVDISRILPIL